MTPSTSPDRLGQVWRTFADRECGDYSPLYAAISHSVADDPELLRLVADAPPSGRQPNVLLGAVHYLLLGDPDHPLAAIYAGAGPRSEAPARFVDYVMEHRAAVADLLATRRTQTNEPGRTAVLAWGLAVAAGELGQPVGLIDAGCSAGLNLLVNRYRIRYSPGPVIGPAGSPVTVDCVIRGGAAWPGPSAAQPVPGLADRIGIDGRPVDLSDPDEVRWLLACVWPDTGRLERTTAAIALAGREPPRILTGDMVADLDQAVAALAPDLPIVVFTSWAAAYLDRATRRALLDRLAEHGAVRPLVWLSAEGPGVVEPVAVPSAIDGAGPSTSVVGLVTFGPGRIDGRALALCHAHGAWIQPVGG